MTENNTINRPVFDMIRTLAVIMVFTIHFLAYRNIPVPNFVFVFFRHCGYGVSLFFAMSGYLIMQSIENSRNIKEYFIKRVSRIIPAYYVILIFGIIVWDIILGQMPADTMCRIGWVRYFLFLNGFLPSDDYFFWNDLWGLWTMSCFMLFYLAAPFIRKWIKTYKGALIMTAVVIVVAYIFKSLVFTLLDRAGVSNADEFAGNCAVFNMISFAFGTTAWYAVREKKDRQCLLTVIVALAVFLIIRDDTYNRIIWSLFTVAVMLAMKDFSYGGKTKWLGKVFSVFSRYSFTIYLVHMPVLDLLEYFSKNVFYLSYVPFIILTFVIVAAVTLLVYHLVEKPLSDLIRRKMR